MLAHVLVSKYQDHLPLDRQATINRTRHGVNTPTSSLSDWVGRSSWVLTPIYNLMKEQLLKRTYIHTDDTPVKVMVKDQGCKTGRLWIYLAPAQANAPPIAVYDYTPDRKGSAPLQFLQGFSGYMQADAYSGYDAVYRQENVIEVGCMAHARRYFEEVADGSKKAQEAMAIIAGLYGVEKRLRKTTPALTPAEIAHSCQVSIRVNFVGFTGFNNAVNHGRPLTTRMATHKEIIFPAYCNASHLLFSRIIIDVEAAIFYIPVQSLPVVSIML